MRSGLGIYVNERLACGYSYKQEALQRPFPLTDEDPMFGVDLQRSTQ